MWDDLNNVSDEMLAAFLDGNTTKEENRLIDDAIVNDKHLMEIVDITNDVISFKAKFDIWKGDYGFWELGIDPVFTREELLNDSFFSDNNEIINDSFIVDNFGASSSSFEIPEAEYMKVYGEERTYEFIPKYDDNLNSDIEEVDNNTEICQQLSMTDDYTLLSSENSAYEFESDSECFDNDTDSIIQSDDFDLLI